MKATTLGGLVSLAAAVGLALPGSALAGSTGGGSCTLQADASLTPPLSATSRPFSYSYTGTLSNCRGTDPKHPSSGRVQAGVEGLPKPTGEGSCLSSTTSGYSFTRWDTGNTTVVKFTTAGAASAVVMRGSVVDRVRGEHKTFRTTEPATPVGSLVGGVLRYSAADPLACLPGGAGVSAATITGQLFHAD
jgi:hypothetical protein